jgi:hypothetical protein
MSHARTTQRLAAGSTLLIGSWAAQAHAQMACNGGPAVDLAIELTPPDANVQRRLERQLAVELGVRDIEICPLVPGRPLLAHVRVQAALPALTPAVVSITNDARSGSERLLDLSALPREARPSAIASATDELLSSLLEAAPPPVSVAPAPLPAPEQAPAEGAAPTQAAPSSSAIGLSGAASRFRDRAQALGFDLGLRLWLLSRLSLTARLGVSRGDYGLPGGTANIAIDLSDDAPSLPDRAIYDEVHGGLDAGVELLEPREPFGLSARAGARLARSTLRIRFESAGSNVGFNVVSGDGSDVQHSWELVGSAGMEAHWQPGVLGFSAALDGLLPLHSTSPADLVLADGSFTPRSGLGAQLGIELSLGIWVALDPRR